MNAPPRIALVTPNLNYGCFLARTLDSVAAQGYPAIEHVVIDGGSADESHAVPGPFLLKLDTHGYELLIFAGAAQTLVQTELLVVEAYGFRPSPTAIRFWELCAHLAPLGLRPADVVDPMGRLGDGLFWQADFLFLRADHPAFQHEQYR